jgi:hypothetical protein
MKTLVIKYLIYILIFAALIISVQKCREANVEHKRLSTNQKALNTPAKTYRTKSNKPAIQTQAVTYTKSELKQYHPELVKKAKDAGIRPSDIKSVGEVSFKAKVDTTIQLKPINDTTVCFNYADKNFDIVGCYVPGHNTANLAAGYRDSLTILVTRVPKRFLFFRWGCKAINLNIISTNKSTIFEYSKYMEIK